MASFRFRCSECGKHYAERAVELVCPDCAGHQQPGGSTRGVLEVELDSLPSVWPDTSMSDPQVLAEFLPLGPLHTWPPLAVGDTPLLEAERLRRHLGTPALWIKDDTRNPSGSTKDRASALVVAKAIEYGRDTIAAASTGNAAIALAATAAASGIRAVLFVPAGAPEVKLVQMLAYGAEVLPIDGTYDEAFELCVQACQRFGWYNRNTALNPFTIEGKKTAALEIAATMTPECPDAVVVPVGDGVIIAGIAKGFADLRRAGLISHIPRLIAVQPKGSAAIVHALDEGNDDVQTVRNAVSIADSLVVQAPRNARLCLRQIRASNGSAVAVADEAIIAAIAELARMTGVFAEPAAAATLAGLHVALQKGLVDAAERIVLLVTGSGLKDVSAAAQSIARPTPVEPTIEALIARSS